MRAKPSIFIEAAEHIDNTHPSTFWGTDTYSCLAISFVESGNVSVNFNSPHRKAFELLYDDAVDSYGIINLAGRFDGDKHHRVFALLFAAEFYRNRNLPT